MRVRAIALFVVGGCTLVNSAEDILPPGTPSTTEPTTTTVGEGGNPPGGGAGDTTGTEPTGGSGGEALESITLNVSTIGEGTVASDVAGIACPDDCRETYEPPVAVTLTATPDAGSNFVMWSGDCEGRDPCEVPFRAMVDVTATFSSDPVLQVSKTGTGDGRITSTPTGIDCGSDCAAAFTPGTMVTLTAADDGQSLFSGWSGACSGTMPCTVTVNALTEVLAEFTQITRPLIVTKPAGRGTLTSIPAGINCGTSCTSDSFDFPLGTQVSVLVTAASGFSFIEWGGSCSGSGSCSVNMSTNRSVSAVLNANVTCGPLFPGFCTGMTLFTRTLSTSALCQQECGQELTDIGDTSGCMEYNSTNCRCYNGSAAPDILPISAASCTD